MFPTILLAVLALLAIAGIVGTFAVVARDGYRAVPARQEPERPAR